MIIPIALVILPIVILVTYEDGTVKLISNFSFPSTILSSVNDMFNVLLLVPATIVAFCVLELKSILVPEVTV